MNTLPDALPDVPLPTAQRYAATLAGVRLVTPTEQGDGLPFLYSETDTETLREFATLRRRDRLSVARAIERITASKRINEAHRSASKRINDTMPETALEAVGEATASPTEQPDTSAAIVAQIARLEAETAILSARASAAEHERQEAADRAIRIEAEATAARRAAAEAGEESRNHRARLARLEAAIKQGRPAGILARVRAALAVLFGQASAVPSLPEFSTASQAEVEAVELKRAA